MIVFGQFLNRFLRKKLGFCLQCLHYFPQPIAQKFYKLTVLGIVCLPFTAASVHAEKVEELGILLDAGYSHDSNLTHADASADKRSDNAVNLNLNVNRRFPLSEHTLLTLSGFVEAKAYETYTGLDRLSAGTEAEYMYRPSGDFEAPTLGLVASIGRDEFRSSLRKSDLYSAGITLRKPVTDRINLYAALKDNITRSNNDVFDTRYTSTQLNMDYGFGNGNTLYLTSEYRVGDIVSSAQPNLAYRQIAAALITDDVFSSDQGAFRDYRLQGKTALFTLGCNLPIDGKKSVDISWRYTNSTADASSAIKYVGNQFSIDYLLGF